MRHIKQRLNECFPTVIAMLNDMDVDAIIAEFQITSTTRHDWASFLASNPTPDPNILDEVTLTYRAICRKYAPYLLDHVRPVNAIDVATRGLFMSYNDYRLKTSEGKGAVLMCTRLKSQAGGHIAAYERGKMYCGNQDGPMSAKDYWILLATKTILCPCGVIPAY